MLTRRPVRRARTSGRGQDEQTSMKGRTVQTGAATAENTARADAPHRRASSSGTRPVVAACFGDAGRRRILAPRDDLVSSSHVEVRAVSLRFWRTDVGHGSVGVARRRSSSRFSTIDSFDRRDLPESRHATVPVTAAAPGRRRGTATTGRGCPAGSTPSRYSSAVPRSTGVVRCAGRDTRSAAACAGSTSDSSVKTWPRLWLARSFRKSSTNGSLSSF